MDVKEAIEFIKALFLGDVKNDRDEDGILYSDRAKDIIELLQRGKKFGAMWEELLHQVNQIHPLHLNGEDVRKIINDIIQKYFPKPSKDFTEKVMERINEKVKDEKKT